MLAQAFSTTEIKKIGLATGPAITSVRRVAFLFNPGCAVLIGTAQS
jgi:hypothetical protein